MATVPLKFVPPSEPNIVTLNVFESSLPDSGFSLIQSTSSVGTYPDYIDSFTVTTANDALDYFAIQWEDADGNVSPLSASIKGGTRSLIGEIVERVKLRDIAGILNEIVVAQDAEAVVEYIYKKDPYSIALGEVSYSHLSGLVDLTLASGLYTEVVKSASTSTAGYTAGIVSEKTGGSDSSLILKSVGMLEKRALKVFGLGGSLIGQLNSSDSTLSITGVKTVLDSSRLLAVTAVITEQMTEVDVA